MLMDLRDFPREIALCPNASEVCRHHIPLGNAHIVTPLALLAPLAFIVKNARVIDLRQSRRLEFWSRSKRQLFFIDSPENHVFFCSFSSLAALIASNSNLASGHCLIANFI